MTPAICTGANIQVAAAWAASLWGVILPQAIQDIASEHPGDVQTASNSTGDRRDSPTAGRQRMLAVALVPELLTGFAPLDLLAQVFRDLQPDSLQRVVARFGMDVRATHGEMDVRPEGRRNGPFPFQQHFGGGDRNETGQPFELLLQPAAQAGVGVNTANSELDFHNVRCP